MKKILFCFFFASQVTAAMGPAPGNAPLNGQAFHLLAQGFADWIKQLREPTPKPSPNPAKHHSTTPSKAMPPHGSSTTSVQLYRNGRQVVVIVPEGYEVKIVRSGLGNYTRFPSYSSETEDV
jgi:hypothetical protein